MSNISSHSLSPHSRRASLPLRLLAVALLLFAQISFANHYHEVDEAGAHGYDCTVCLQLHSVKNTAGSSSSPYLVDHLVVSIDPRGTTADLLALKLFLPPSRAPPLY